MLVIGGGGVPLLCEVDDTDEMLFRGKRSLINPRINFCRLELEFIVPLSSISVFS